MRAFRLLGPLCLAFLAGCRQGPVESLKPILAKIEQNGTQSPTKYRAPLVASSLKYDVRKTDSLVSPYVATVHWYSHDRGAEITEKGSTPGLWGWNATLGFQEGKWRLTELECEGGTIGGGGLLLPMRIPDSVAAEEDWRAAFHKAKENQ
jgi:hypothetical protein